ncbi:hypothetical protein TWF696_004879 [Orbilia brochopaga]|uniref:Uncharacterized protein n=1 Tax=Orbilia brochopaga TaxID=3140254 RepID=A0AAV9UZC3_9PEZI
MTSRYKRFGYICLVLAAWLSRNSTLVVGLAINPKPTCEGDSHRPYDDSAQQSYLSVPCAQDIQKPICTSKPTLQPPDVIERLGPRGLPDNQTITNSAQEIQDSPGHQLDKLYKRTGGRNKGKGKDTSREEDVGAAAGTPGINLGNSGLYTDLELQEEHFWNFMDPTWIYNEAYTKGAFDSKNLRRAESSEDVDVSTIASDLIVQVFPRNQLNPYSAASVATVLEMGGADDWDRDSASYRPVQINKPPAVLRALVSATDAHMVLAWDESWLSAAWGNWLFLSWMLGSDPQIDDQSPQTLVDQQQLLASISSSNGNLLSVISIVNIKNPNTWIVLNTIANSGIAPAEDRRAISGMDGDAHGESEPVEDAVGYRCNYEVMAENNFMSEEDEAYHLGRNGCFFALFGTAEVDGIKQALLNFHKGFGSPIIQSIGFAISENHKKAVITVDLWRPGMEEPLMNDSPIPFGGGLSPTPIPHPAKEMQIEVRMMLEDGPQPHPLRPANTEVPPSYFPIFVACPDQVANSLVHTNFLFLVSASEQHIVYSDAAFSGLFDGNEATTVEVPTPFALRFEAAFMTAWRHGVGNAPIRQITFVHLSEETQNFLRPHLKDLPAQAYVYTQERDPDTLFQMTNMFQQTREGKPLANIMKTPELRNSYVNAFVLGWSYSSKLIPHVRISFGYTGQDEASLGQIASEEVDEVMSSLSPHSATFSEPALSMRPEIPLADLVDDMIQRGAELLAQLLLLREGAVWKPAQFRLISSMSPDSDQTREGILRKFQISPLVPSSANPIHKSVAEFAKEETPHDETEAGKRLAALKEFVLATVTTPRFEDFVVTDAERPHEQYHFSVTLNANSGDHSLPRPRWSYPHVLVVRKLSAAGSFSSLADALTAAWTHAGFHTIPPALTTRVTGTGFNKWRGIIFQQISPETERILRKVGEEYADLLISSSVLTVYTGYPPLRLKTTLPFMDRFTPANFENFRFARLLTLLYGTAEINAAHKIFTRYNIFGEGKSDGGNWYAWALCIHYSKDGSAPKIVVILKSLNHPNAKNRRILDPTHPGLFYYTQPAGYTLERGVGIFHLQGIYRDRHRSTDSLGRTDLLRQTHVIDRARGSISVMLKSLDGLYWYTFKVRHTKRNTGGINLFMVEAPEFLPEPFIDKSYVDALAGVYFQAWRDSCDYYEHLNPKMEPCSLVSITITNDVISAQTAIYIQVAIQAAALQSKQVPDQGPKIFLTKDITTGNLGLEVDRDMGGLLLLGSIEVAAAAAMLQNYPNNLGGRYRIVSITCVPQRATSDDKWSLRLKVEKAPFPSVNPRTRPIQGSL